jgi:hypothetical protein
MKKIVTAAAIVIAVAISGFSQTQATGSSVKPCTLNISKAPAIRGITLGMSTADALRLFPGSADRGDIKTALSSVGGYPHFGMINFGLSPSHFPNAEGFAGIDVINFVFLDGRIAEFEVQYSAPPNGAVWRNLDDFINKIADTFKLPHADSWTPPQNFTYGRSLKCDGFQLLAANLNSQGQLRVMTADSPSKTQRERLIAFEEKGRREFKP